MPNVNLDAAFVRNVEIPLQGKVNYYDNAITGFILEVRCSGGMTYALRYRDTHGRQNQQKIGDAKSVTFDAARRAAEKIRSRVVLGESPIEERKLKRTIPTIAETYRDTYFPHLKNTRRSMGSDLSFWKNHLLPSFGSKYLDELKQEDVLDAQLAMRNAGYSTGMANKFIVQIRYMYNVAKRFKIPGSDFNPGAGAKQMTVLSRQRFLSPEEIERLRVAVERSENTQLKYIVALLLFLGCRKSELFAAKWQDFDLERRTWRIPLSKSGKTRHVPLSEAAILVLKSLPRWDGCPYVVPNPHTRMPLTGIFVSWDTARKRAGLPDVRLHDLRHTWASSALAGGASLLAVSRALGHASISQSEVYSHLADSALLACADGAATAMGKAWTETKQSTVQAQN